MHCTDACIWFGIVFNNLSYMLSFIIHVCVNRSDTYTATLASLFNSQLSGVRFAVRASASLELGCKYLHITESMFSIVVKSAEQNRNAHSTYRRIYLSTFLNKPWETSTRSTKVLTQRIFVAQCTSSANDLQRGLHFSKTLHYIYSIERSCPCFKY